VVLVVRGAGGAWCWWCVVLVVRSLSRPTSGRLATCSHISAQFIICRAHMTLSFATSKP
jgi:hypothetical protein